MEFLANWGLEILFALISAGVMGYAKYYGDKMKNQVEEYKSMINDKKNQQTEDLIEEKLEPIYEELEDLRAYIRETKEIEKTHMSLIVASYRFRLVQLCKQFIKQGYMTQPQYDQLTEFYKLYEGLGGNGQAKQYYDKAIILEIIPEE